MADKKPGLEIVLGGMGKPKAAAGDEPDATMGGSEEAAQAVLDAIDTKSASALAKALKAFVVLADDDSAEGL